MPRKKSYITVTDQFCGAGGSSQGVRRLAQRSGGGIEVKLALNHWKLAIETHNTNFPDTLHDCTDISAADPRRYPSTDILITSPECTTHSPAGGNSHKSLKMQLGLYDTGKVDPGTERSRATMWDVCRFAEYHQYSCIIVENVVEAKTRWALFDTWLTAMHVLGYDHRLVFHNSMHHHPTPQSRDRMYIVFWKKGNKVPMLDHTPPAHCPKCATNVSSVQTWKDKRRNWGKYRQQYVYCCPSCSMIVEPYYYAAFNCIDWSKPGKRIADRKLKEFFNKKKELQYYKGKSLLPLAPNTLSRVQYGLDKYSSQPFLVDNKQTTGVGFRTKQVTDVTCTMHTDPRVSVVIPFLIDSGFQGEPRLVNEVKRTQTTQHSEGLVIPAFIVENYGASKSKSITEPLGTQTCATTHGVLTNENWNSFINYYYGGSQMASRPIDALRTVNCKDRAALVSYQTPTIEECYYRTLFAYEIKGAMAFDQDYVVLGDTKDQVKQLGNAVTPPSMEWLVEQCVKSLS